MATVYVYRRMSPPILRKPDIEVNGEMVAELPTDTYTVFHVAPGAHKLTARYGGLDGFMLTTSTSLVVVPGAIYYAEVVNNPGGGAMNNPRVVVNSSSEPPSSIRSCTYVQPNAAFLRK